MENFSKEQLLTYIKKQKIKIKQLEIENESLIKSTNSQTKIVSNKPPEPGLFWATVQNDKTPFYKNLAVAALSRFVDTVDRQISRPLNKQSAFLTWKLYCLETKFMKSEQSLINVKSQLQQSEQRVLKLKTLLARTHQSKQKTMEDTSMYKKAQEESAAALRDLKEREQQERDALRESLRAQSIQSAFQQDSEIALQRAADEFVSRQHMMMQTNGTVSSNPGRVLELEGELMRLKTEIHDLTLNLSNAKLQLERQESQIILQAQELSEYSQTHRTGSNEVDRLRAKLLEETQSRQDLEREVKLLLSTRSLMAREIENIAVARKSQELLLALAELEETRIQLELSQEALRSLNAELDDQQVEVNHLRKSASDVSQLRLECHQLRSTIVDLRRVTRSITQVTPVKTRPELPEGLSLSSLSELREAFLECEGTALECLRREGELLSGLRSARQEVMMSRWISERREEKHQLLHSNVMLGVSRELLDLLNSYSSLTKDADDAGKQRAATVALDRLSSHCQSLEDRIGSLTALVVSMEEAQTQSVDEFKSMTWETNGLIVNANSDIPILIPLPTLTASDACSGTLSWHIFSDSLQSLSLSLTASPPIPSGPMGKIPQYPLTLVSVMAAQHINNSPTLCGTYEVAVPPNIVLGQGTLLLRVQNSGMWGSIKVGYKITFGPTDATGRNDASASVRQREQSEAFDKRVEIARLSAELVHSKQLHNQIAIAVEAGHGLHSEFCAWLQLHGLNPNEVGTLASETEMAPGPSLSADEVARFELLWDNLSQRSEKLNGKRVDLQEALTVIKASCPPINKLIKPVVVNTSSRGTSHDSSGSNDSTAVYSCDSLLVKAARDFRLQVPLLPGRRFGVRWEIALVFPSTSHVKDQTLGFSILRQRSDGYLPQVEPYKVYSASGGQGFVEIECDESITEESPTKDVTLVFLFDNTFSWYRQKRVRYKIEVFELEDEPADDIPDSTSLAAASQDSLENTLKQLDASDLLSDDISPYTSFNHIGQINDADLEITNSHELVEWVRRVLVFSAESSICDRKNY